LNGKWLEKLGWHIGSEVHVKASTDSIVITHCPLSVDAVEHDGIRTDYQWSDCVLKLANRAMRDDPHGAKIAISRLSKELTSLVDERHSSGTSADARWEDIKKSLKLALESARYSDCGRDVKEQVVSENPAVSCPCLDVLRDFLSRICK